MIVFSNREDALRVWKLLPERFEKYGLSVHPEKSRLIDFRHPFHSGRQHDGFSHPETFDLLGFTHYWGKSRRGYWQISKKTIAKRLPRAIQSIDQWCRSYRHFPVREQWPRLCQKIRGHFAY